MTGRAAVRFVALLVVALSLAALPGCGGAAPAGPAAPPAEDAGRHPAFPETWVHRAHPVVGTGGMVASTQPDASMAGVSMLKAGGNAVDGAVATALALAVTHPQAGNLGGGGFLVLRLADGTTAALDFRETAPAAATRDMFLDADGALTDASLFGPRAAGVPGSVAGLFWAHRAFGRLPWADVVAPAIALAEQGFVPDGFLADDAEEMWEKLDEAERPGASTGAYDETRRIFGGLARGVVLRQPELAATLRRLVEHGPEDFYRGETAGLIVAAMEAHGGLIDAWDLATYQPVWCEPLRFTYREHTVISMSPPSSGGATMAQIANILSGWDLSELGFGSPLRVHLFAEAARRAYADRNALLGDPAFVEMPLATLTSHEYAARRRADIDIRAASRSDDVGPGLPPGAIHPFPKLPRDSPRDMQRDGPDDPPAAAPAAAPRGDGNTTHLSVVDRDGGAVSLTTTLNTAFGSKVVVAGAGFLLNNEMDDFAARPGHPNTYGLVQGEANAVAPGKRMLSSMSPSIVLDPDGELFLVTGTPGGGRIINVTLQSILNAVDFGMDAAQLVSAPRVHHQHRPDTLWYEEGGLPPTTIDALEALGHTLEERDVFCDVQAIMLRADGARVGAADPRAGGAAIAE